MRLSILFRTAAAIGGLSLAFGATAQTQQTTTTTKQETTTRSTGTTGTHKKVVHHKTTVRNRPAGAVVRHKSTQTRTETTTSGQ